MKTYEKNRDALFEFANDAQEEFELDELERYAQEIPHVVRVRRAGYRRGIGPISRFISSGD